MCGRTTRGWRRHSGRRAERRLNLPKAVGSGVGDGMAASRVRFAMTAPAPTCHWIGFPPDSVAFLSRQRTYITPRPLRLAPRPPTCPRPSHSARGSPEVLPFPASRHRSVY